MTVTERERLLRRARRLQEIGESLENIIERGKLKLAVSWANYAEREVRDMRSAVVRTQIRETERARKATKK